MKARVLCELIMQFLQDSAPSGDIITANSFFTGGMILRLQRHAVLTHSSLGKGINLESAKLSTKIQDLLHQKAVEDGVEANTNQTRSGVLSVR